MTPISFRDNSISAAPVTVIVVTHAGALAALFFPSTYGVAALAVLYVVSGLGISVGYHRLMAHRSFRAAKWVERSLCTAGALALQGGPGNWVAMHRLHHAYADTDFDPHNARRGFFHSHMRWILNKLPDEFLDARYTHIARDVIEDPYYRWLDEYHYLTNVAVGALLLVLGGVPAVLWGVCLRIALAHHATWLVNSASHIWGTKPFAGAAGRNNLAVALLTMGEGWHNNHHAHPRSARLGLAWYQVDTGWWLVSLLRRCGLAVGVWAVRAGPENPTPGTR